MWITEQGISVIHYVLCSLHSHASGPLIGRTINSVSIWLYFPQVLGVYGRWDLRSLCRQFSFVLNAQSLTNKTGLYEHVITLFLQLQPVTLCYITPFNLTDGDFPAHHPSSPLHSLFYLTTIIMYSPCLTPRSCPSSSVPPSLHLPSPSLSALPTSTVLMSISHSRCSSRQSPSVAAGAFSGL